MITRFPVPAMPSATRVIHLTLPAGAEPANNDSLPGHLLTAINDKIWELPFEAVCTNGGPKTDEKTECSDLRYERPAPNQLRGSFAYAFTEETNIGCSDQHYTDRVRGRYYFSYDLQTGVMSVDIPQIHADYDPEEI
ncbi:hypothetical protein [Brevifollis gellanilyticus]|uniref:Uncharacterized protein n=1 Tax=Brevifollis gellanilyticus TaxID=748831 RepID=A0A512M7M7_9BACT|nr:hypothetical protein [Brevifollis gellanilyticus]GEP42739.1 hypothetical protein BGE01nite_20300 [Brevifollis gellanilyticus]